MSQHVHLNMQRIKHFTCSVQEEFTSFHSAVNILICMCLLHNIFEIQVFYKLIKLFCLMVNENLGTGHCQKVQCKSPIQHSLSHTFISITLSIFFCRESNEENREHKFLHLQNKDMHFWHQQNFSNLCTFKQQRLQYFCRQKKLKSLLSKAESF